MSRWNLAWLLGVSALALLGISLTFSAPAPAGNLQKKHENLKLLVDVLEEVQQKYVKDLDPKKMRELVENMINSGLERTDPYSSFYNAKEYKQLQDQSRGKFGGIGIRIGLDRGGQVLVESPMVGTPAFEAGILAGDIIVKVDGKSTETMALKDVVAAIQGEPGTKISVSVLHEGEKQPVDLEIVRAEIKVDSILGDQRMKDKLQEWDFWIDENAKIGYVRIVAFTETTVQELTKVVDTLQNAGMKGLVVDLRNNPGGLLRSAVEVSSMFLPEGKNVVTTKGRGEGQQEVYNARHDGKIKPGTYYPIAILINRYSASASEIVAAALQDHLRAIIVGERSYGKGSVQNIIPMEGGASALKLTTASYWRPSGRNIHRFPDNTEKDEWGVSPDKGYEVKLSDEERLQYYKWRRERDIVKRQPAKEPEVDKDGKKKEPFRDRVLDKALEYIRAEMKKQKQGDDAQAPGAQELAPAFDAALPRENAIAERVAIRDERQNSARTR